MHNSSQLHWAERQAGVSCLFWGVTGPWGHQASVTDSSEPHLAPSCVLQPLQALPTPHPLLQSLSMFSDMFLLWWIPWLWRPHPPAAQKSPLAQGGFADEGWEAAPINSQHLKCSWLFSKPLWRNTTILPPKKSLNRGGCSVFNQRRATTHVHNRQHPTALKQTNALYSHSQPPEELFYLSHSAWFMSIPFLVIFKEHLPVES